MHTILNKKTDENGRKRTPAIVNYMFDGIGQ